MLCITSCAVCIIESFNASIWQMFCSPQMERRAFVAPLYTNLLPCHLQTLDDRAQTSTGEHETRNCSAWNCGRVRFCTHTSAHCTSVPFKPPQSPSNHLSPLQTTSVPFTPPQSPSNHLRKWITSPVLLSYRESHHIRESHHKGAIFRIVTKKRNLARKHNVGKLFSQRFACKSPQVEKEMFRFVVLPCFDLGLTVPMYFYTRHKNLHRSSRSTVYRLWQLWAGVNQRICTSCHMTYGAFYI